MMRCYIALGGNLGPVEETFRRALERLEESASVTVRTRSQVYRSEAVGAQAGGEFLNAAAGIDAGLPPRELLDLLQTIEAEFGRTRDVHWGPRPLDLDLILYGEEIIDEPGLQVPHPACWYRRFVLEPLADIAAEVLHPVLQCPVGELRSRLLVRPLPVALVGIDSQTAEEYAARFAEKFPEATLFATGPRDAAVETAAIAVCVGRYSNGGKTAAGSSVATKRVISLPAESDFESALRDILQAALGEVTVEM